MVIATILAHGALITSVGLALAVWIKRQSRAIAISVGSFILITAAWPFFMATIAKPQPGRALVTVSPFVVCVMSVQEFANRQFAFARSIVGSGTFWAVEVFILAMGLLWLTVRTFDGCFDRISDQPRCALAWCISVMILAAMIAAGSFVWAIDSWIEGVRPQTALTGTSSLGVVFYSVAIALGLILIAVEAATSGRPTWTADHAVAPAAAARRLVLSRWGASFQHVLLLAVGPGLVALALATAHKPPRYEPQYTKTAAGAQVVTSYVRADPNIPHAGEVPVGQRFIFGAVLIVTILAHGSAGISVGLALTLTNGWSRRVIAAAVGVTVVIAFVVPLCLIRLDYHSAVHGDVELRHGRGLAANSARRPRFVHRARDSLACALLGRHRRAFYRRASGRHGLGVGAAIGQRLESPLLRAPDLDDSPQPAAQTALVAE